MTNVQKDILRYISVIYIMMKWIFMNLARICNSNSNSNEIFVSHFERLKHYMSQILKLMIEKVINIYKTYSHI